MTRHLVGFIPMRPLKWDIVPTTVDRKSDSPVSMTSPILTQRKQGFRRLLLIQPVQEGASILAGVDGFEQFVAHRASSRAYFACNSGRTTAVFRLATCLEPHLGRRASLPERVKNRNVKTLEIPDVSGNDG